MEIITERHQHAELVKVSGHIDHHSAPELEQSLNAIVKGGQHNIVVDLSGVTYISSAGLKTLQATAKSARGGLLGGDLRLAGLQPNIKEIFKLIGFTDIFQIYDHASDALESFMPAELPPEAYFPPNI
jgi:anti-anti-sigma factor